jgi:hypothetical protein
MRKTGQIIVQVQDKVLGGFMHFDPRFQIKILDSDVLCVSVTLW